MHKLAMIVAAAGLLVACGGDEGGKKDPENNEPVPAGFSVTTESGRIFEGERLEIRIEEQPNGETALMKGSVIAEEESTNARFDMRFWNAAAHLTQGKTNPQLSASEPNRLGMGIILIDSADLTSFESSKSNDLLELNFDAGKVTGTMGTTRENKDFAGTFEGGYDLTCFTLEGGQLVEDAEFVSDFCAPFAEARAPQE